MMILEVISWWYGAGWARVASRIGSRVSSILEAFSVGLLARTLFDPFRQIDAGGSGGKTMQDQLRAFGDKLFSRFFGAGVRSLFIVMGLFSAAFAGLLGIIQLLVWPLVPLLPLIGVVLAIVGLDA
ncbi:MAG TPA: hypothetical protein VLF43_00215 [Candidatus Saccharimonadales bacterium]|nr:hypothetical protein [Candidatus Saccharimonadales bacterium]